MRSSSDEGATIPGVIRYTNDRSFAEAPRTLVRHFARRRKLDCKGGGRMVTLLAILSVIIGGLCIVGLARMQPARVPVRIDRRRRR